MSWLGDWVAARCGPPVAEWTTEMRRADRQKRPERKPAAPPMLPVILGTGEAYGVPFLPDEAFETFHDR